MAYRTIAERIGFAEGYEEGYQEGLRSGIELCLEIKFGPDGLRLMPEIHQLEGREILLAILNGIRTATTLEELRIWDR